MAQKRNTHRNVHSCPAPISQAIRENRVPEYMLYGFALAFVLTGEVVIFWSIRHGYGLSTMAGVVLNGLAWPAYSQTRTLRKENLILRMLEIPLSKAKTADEAAKMLTDRFAGIFGNTSTEAAVHRKKTER